MANDNFEGWIDMGRYWLYPDEQCKKRWFRARSHRLTSSRVGEALGLVNYGDTPDIIAQQLVGLAIKSFDEASKVRMKHGVVTESIARSWYTATTGNIVTEVGHAVPKWNLFLGGSPDGAIGDAGLLEIKCPQRMYVSLLRYETDIAMGCKIKNYKHIPIGHYLQMMTCMACMDKKWCQFVVYCTPEDKVFSQRVVFDQKEWDTIFYPQIVEFIDNKLKPLIRGV